MTRIDHCLALCLLAIVSHTAAADLPAPVHLTAEQDHQRLLDLLGIKTLRPGADPNHPDAPNAVNYDESKVAPYKLPDALVLQTERE